MFAVYLLLDKNFWNFRFFYSWKNNLTFSRKANSRVSILALDSHLTSARRRRWMYSESIVSNIRELSALWLISSILQWHLIILLGTFFSLQVVLDLKCSVSIKCLSEQHSASFQRFLKDLVIFAAPSVHTLVHFFILFHVIVNNYKEL